MDGKYKSVEYFIAKLLIDTMFLYVEANIMI